MRFVVYGVGAVGGVVAARLFDAGHDVMAVARGAQGEAIQARGLTLATPAGAQAFPIAVVPSVHELKWRAGDVVLLAVKSQHTHVALAELAAVAPATVPVACMQNGVANEPAALRWFGRVYGIVVMLPATFLEPGVVAAHSTPVPGLLDVGRWPCGTDELAHMLVDALRSAGFDSQPLDDVASWKYAKLLANLSNAVEALCGTDARNGRITQLARDEGRRCLDAAGIAHISPAEDRTRRGGLLDVQPAVGQPRQGSSTWQSLARRTGSIETDYLNGEIALLGRLHGIPTPVNSLLQQVARDHARDARPPGGLRAEELLTRLDIPAEPP